jgi:hypothetical protein
MKKRLALIGAVVLSLAFAGCSGGSESFVVDDFINVELSGFNETAQASARIKTKSFAEQVLIDSGYTPKKIDEIYYEGKQKDIEKYEALQKIVEEMKVDLSVSDELKNGDTIDIILTYDEELAKEKKFDFIMKKDKYEVQGLEELTQLDMDEILESVELEFDGVSPEASISLKLDNKRPELESINFKIGGSGIDPMKIRNGDNIVIFAETDVRGLNSRGFKINKDTANKTITVDGIPEYLTNADLITGDLLKEVKLRAELKFDSIVSPGKDYVVYDKIRRLHIYPTETVLAGESIVKEMYFFVDETESEYKKKNNNKLFVIYETNVESTLDYYKKPVGKHTFYTLVGLRNIIVDGEGKIQTAQDAPYVEMGQTDYAKLLEQELDDGAVNIPIN